LPPAVPPSQPQVGNEVYSDRKLWDGFRSPALIRFVSGNPFYLSHTNGGPRMFVNIEDHISRSTGKPNKEFMDTLGLFMDRCDGRLHWGKAGWPEFNGCFDGAKEYAEWCDFGCAVQVRNAAASAIQQRGRRQQPVAQRCRRAGSPCCAAPEKPPRCQPAL
jgi:hypothetical protein